MNTGVIILIGLLLILAVDLWLYIKGGFSNTISWWIWSHSVQYPIIPFLFGILAGHFFWNQGLNVNCPTGVSP
jgi:hypothetical protein